MEKRLQEFLGARGAAYEVLRHGPAVTAQEQAAESHTAGRAMAKVVVVKERDGLALAVIHRSFLLLPTVAAAGTAMRPE